MGSLSILENLTMFGSSFVEILVSPMSLLLMLFSMIIGIVFGVLPGLSATIAIALFASITYSLDLYTALVILFGIYIGAIYGGSISAMRRGRT